MTFTSRIAFDEPMARCGAAIFADLPNHATVAPILQVSRIGRDIPSSTGA